MATHTRSQATRSMNGPVRLMLLAGLMFADPASRALAQSPDPKSGQSPTQTAEEAARARGAGRGGRIMTPTPPPGQPPIARPMPGQPPNAPQPMAPQPVNPGAAPGGQPAPITQPQGGAVSADVGAQLSDTSLKVGPLDNVEVRLLVDLVASALDLQVMDLGQALADKRVTLLTQIEIPREKLIDFLALMLEQNGQMMVRDSVSGIFMIKPVGDFPGAIGGEGATTRLIPTPGVRPSSLQQAINIGVRPSNNPATGLSTPMQMAFMDDLGVILVTDTPRRLKQLENLVEVLCKEQAGQVWTRLPLRYISANIARQRILELLGLTQQRTGVVGGAGAINPETGQPIGQPTPPGMSGSVASISSLPQRLTIDPQGNDLLLKGSASEASLVTQALQIVDVPSRLVGKYYNVGGAAQTVASQGRAQGLGEVVTLQTGFGSAVGADGRPTPQLNLAGLAGGGPQETLQGGPRFVIDPQNRGFTYFGTPEQQAQLEAMMQGLEQLLVSDEVVYEFYPLLNAKADKVADALRGLIANQVPSSGSGSVLLPGGSALGGRNSRGAGAPRDFRSPLLRDRSSNQATTTAAAAANRMTTGDTAIDATEDVFVLEYEDTNTILVKAPRRLQPQFRQLISKLDIRRPQVYIEAQIIVVTGSDEQRLAVETQLINAGGKGGVLRTLFTPSPSQSGTVSGNITVPPVINPLTGITAAIINSDMVPVIITAIATTTNARIVASPKILVDDNVEATILSKEERPTQTQVTNSGSGGTTTGFGGFEEAGPELTVKPQISAGGYIRLNYSLDLSAFIGEAPSAFTPPPRQTNKIESESVTVPSDSTIVVGGLTFDQKRKTVVKVPLLGDIPIIGHAFRDERDNVSSSTIYVFITPRIMREEDFDDLRLLSKGPMVDVKLPEDLPPPRLVAVENVAPVLPEPSPTLAPADRPPPPLPSGD